MTAHRALPLLAALTLCACARPSADPAVPPAATLALAVSSTDLGTQAAHGVELTAQVRDAAGRPVPGVPVRFEVDRGAVQVLAEVTDGFGTASARLGAVGAAAGRTITATARAGRLSAQAKVHVSAAVDTAAAPKCCKV